MQSNERQSTPVTRVLEDSFVYSCAFERQRGFEQFTAHHVLLFSSPVKHISTSKRCHGFEEKSNVISSKESTYKTSKLPAADKEYKIISVILTDIALHQFASDSDIIGNKQYDGENILFLKPDALMKSYFQSLLPYVEKSKKSVKDLPPSKRARPLNWY